jgi:hypothetical protein
MLLGVVRSASTDEVAAAMMREVLAEGPLLALAAAVPGEDARTRAALAGSQLIGLVLARYNIRVDPLASMTPDEIAAAIGPAVERYLFDA